MFNKENPSLQENKFGNERLRSSILTQNKENRFLHSDILVSQKGKEFIDKNRGVLSNLDDLFAKLQEEKTSFKDFNSAFSDGSFIQYIDSGNNSNVFKLTMRSGDEYAIKTKRPDAKKTWQPYDNEMLQVQLLKLHLKKTLNLVNADLPEYLLASSDITIREFVDGERSATTDTKPLVKVIKEAREFIKKGAKKDMLWKDVYLDIGVVKNSYGDEVITVSPRDVVKTPEGKLIWIDPLVYGVNTQYPISGGPWWKKLLTSSGKKYSYEG